MGDKWGKKTWLGELMLQGSQEDTKCPLNSTCGCQWWWGWGQVAPGGVANEKRLYAMSQWRVFFGAVGLTLGPQLSASPGNLLELHILDSIPKPTTSETLGKKPSHWCLNKLSRQSQCRPTFETHRPREGYTWGEKEETTGRREGRTVKGGLWFPKWKRFFNRFACYE